MPDQQNLKNCTVCVAVLLFLNHVPYMVIDHELLALETTHDPKIPSTVGFSDGIPSAVGFPGSILLIDSAHGNLLVCFIDWPHV